MKKISILSILVLVVFGSFFSCQPKDNKAPNIYFSSEVETSQDWVLQEYYELPSATASDNVDGDVTDKITLSNDLIFYELRSDSIPGQTVYKCENKIKNGTKGFVGKAGKYAIVYSVTDKASNKGSKTLNVNVLNSLNNWSVNSSGVKINYLVKRKYINGDQLRIGGVYTDTNQEDEYTWEDGYANVNGKPVTTTFAPDKAINYRIKISKIANIGGLAMYVDFNRYSRAINFADYETGVIQEMSKIGGVYVKTDFVYYVAQVSGINEYNPEIKSFTVTYQIERWKEDDNGSKIVDGRTWSLDRTCTYQESFIPE